MELQTFKGWFLGLQDAMDAMGQKTPNEAQWKLLCSKVENIERQDKIQMPNYTIPRTGDIVETPPGAWRRPIFEPVKFNPPMVID